MKVNTLIRDEGYIISNIDSTLCLEKPKIKDFIPSMQQTIAAVLNVDIKSISIKATTAEKMGFVGREEGVAAYAVILLEKSSN